MLFGWMGENACMLPEGCTVPLKGVAVYLFLLVFAGAMLYWNRHRFRAAVEQLRS